MYENLLNGVRVSDPHYAGNELLAFTFAPTSRDARISEGDFLVAISNEDDELDLDFPWHRHLGLSFQETQALLEARGLSDSGW